MSRELPIAGAPDPKLRTSRPLEDEEDDTLGAELESGACYINDTPHGLRATGMALLLACMGITAALAADKPAPVPARGERLYEQHCGGCHTPGIHHRRDTLPISRDELLGLVDVFRRQAGLAWTPEEIDDVVEYLNRTRYRFAPK